MELTQRHLVRVAGRIRQQLSMFHSARGNQTQAPLDILLDRMQTLQAARQNLSLCRDRSWAAATSRAMAAVSSALREVPYYVGQVEQAMEHSQVALPSLRDVYQELIQTQEEFGELLYHDEGDLLAVQTEPIELEDVYLGEFEIQVHVFSLSQMQHGTVYRIVALDPHPAASNESVTHPHVSDENLCAGDAGAAIKAALAAGRLCDFFMVVRSVLTNYNSSSPYVSLDRWEGTPCYDCGYIMGSDDAFYCDRCQNDYCQECISHCSRCDAMCCRDCLGECSVCGELACYNCMTKCPDCRQPLCSGCLDDRACTCNEEQEENENDSTKTAADQRDRLAAGAGTEAA